MFILRSLRNPKRYIQIGTAPIHIGRSAGNTLVIREKSVSRTHATIQLESGVPVLTDLKSTRGTYVNGVQVQSRRLKPGDVISFGTVQWKLEESTAGQSRPKSSGLVLSSVSNPRQQFHLSKEPVRIGRGQGNQLKLSDISISREHALIQFENGKFIILDKNSSGGTFVNNKRVQKATLKPGDVVSFGEDQWRVMLPEEIQPSAGAIDQPVRQIPIQPLHVGNYSLSPNPVYGGALQLADEGRASKIQDYQTPIFVRPCHFGALIDRKTEVKSASASGSNSPLQYYGPHGVGKSTLLCYLSHHPFADTYPDGVVHLLARGRKVIDLLQNIFNSFYDQPVGFVATEDEIRSRLRFKNALILLDDVELSPEETSELMAAAPKCTFILASSKKCLPNPKGGRLIELDGFKTEDGLELFGKVLGRALNSEELSLVRLVCKALGNKPVRIIQAASYVRGVGGSVGGVAGALNVATPADALNELIVQSLSEVERFVIAVLAALGGGSIHNRHLPSLVGVKDTKSVLGGLMGRGLVREIDNRYSLAGDFVDYLQKEWDLSEWADRILEHFSSWVERHQDNPEYVLFELEAILSILTWAVGAGRWQAVLRFSRGVEGLFMAGRQWGAWESVLQSGLQAAQMLGDQAAEAWAFHQLGTRAMCLGDSSTAQSALDQAYRIRQSIGDRFGAELTRQNQNLLSAAIPVPSKPPAPKPITKPSPGFLRPLFFVGGIVSFLIVVTIIIINWPTPPAPIPVPEPDTVTVPAPIREPTDTPTPTRLSPTPTKPSSTPTKPSPTPTRPSSTPTKPSPTSTPDRCDLLEDINISYIVQDPLYCSNYILLNIKMPGGVPGIEYNVPGDNKSWEYRSKLGAYDSYKCWYEDYQNKIHCDFNISTDYFNSYRPVSLYVNGCSQSVSEANVYVPPEYCPTVTPVTPEIIFCQSDLSSSECSAAGGYWLESYCECGCSSLLPEPACVDAGGSWYSGICDCGY